MKPTATKQRQSGKLVKTLGFLLDSDGAATQRAPPCIHNNISSSSLARMTTVQQRKQLLKICAISYNVIKTSDRNMRE